MSEYIEFPANAEITLVKTPIDDDIFENEVIEITYEQGAEICKILGVDPDKVSAIRIEASGLTPFSPPCAIIKRIKRNG